MKIIFKLDQASYVFQYAEPKIEVHRYIISKNITSMGLAKGTYITFLWACVIFNQLSGLF